MIYKEIYVSKKEPLVVEIAEGTTGIDIGLHVADWTIPTSATAQIYLSKPSGALIFNATEIVDNAIIISPTTQMTAEVGVSKGQIRIVNGAEILHTFVFYFKVEPSIIDDAAIESQDEFTALEEAIAVVSDAVTHTELQGKGSATKPVYFDGNGMAQTITVPAVSEIISISSQSIPQGTTYVELGHFTLEAGIYDINAVVQWTDYSTSGGRRACIAVNESDIQLINSDWRLAVSGVLTQNNLHAFLTLSSSSTVSIFVINQSSDGAKNASAKVQYCKLA